METFKEKLNRQELLVKAFTQNGFTEQQARFIISLLNEYIPIV